MHSQSIRLHLLPVEKLVLHEEVEPARVAELRERLRSSGMLRNPPIVTPLDQSRFLVLDGATRVTALEQLSIPTLVAQVVEYSAPQVQLQTWCHFLPMQTGEGLAQLATELGLQTAWLPLRDAQRALSHRQALAYVADRRERVLLLSAPSPEVAPYPLLRQFVARYGTAFQRIAWEEVKVLLQQGLRHEGVYVVFPAFTPEEVRQLALRGERLPAGITRHIIAGRLLHADIPLEELRRPGSFEQKQQWFQHWWQERLRRYRLRYYPEPTFVFDE